MSYFLSFCIEQYKNRKKLTGVEAIRQLNRAGVLEYLQANYDVLHTQSSQWILEEIEELVNNKQLHP